MRVLRLMALWAVSALSCAPPPPFEMCRTGNGGGTGTADDERLVVAGAEARVLAKVALTCPTGTALRAHVSIRDPDNLPVTPAQAEPLVEQIFGSHVEATARFQTVKAGPYHVTVRFEPNLGLFQADVIAAQNRIDARPELVVRSDSPLADCRRFDVSPHGRVLCLSGPVRAVERDGGVSVLEPLAVAAARDGVVLWTVNTNNQVRRWEETDERLAQLPGAEVSITFDRFGPSFLAPGPKGLGFATPGTLGRVTHDGGSLAVEYFPLPSGLVARPKAFWVDHDDYLLPMGVEKAGRGDFLCTGKFGGPSDAGICELGTMANPFGQELVGVDSAGLWLATSDSTPPLLTQRTYTETNRLAVPAPWSVPALVDGAWDTGATLIRSGQTMLVTRQQGAFVFQKFANLPVVNVTSTWLALRDGNGDVLLFRR